MSKNFAVSTIAGSVAPGVSGTSFTVPTGHGARFTEGQPAVVYPAGTLPSPESAEVVTVSTIVGDVLTVVRAVESSTPRSVVLGDQLVQGLTAAMWDALAAAVAGKADTSALSAYLTTAAATDTYAPLPSGTPTVGQVPVVTTVSPLALGWGAGGSSLPAYGIKRTYGAAGDMRVVTDATVSGTTLTSPTANFVTGDVGKMVVIQGAGADNGSAVVRAVHVTTIAARVSATQVTLTAAVINAVTAPRTVTDGAINANSTNFTSATASFTQADVGKKITIPGAGQPRSGAGGDPSLETRIVRITNSTTAVVDVAAVTTVSAKTVALPGAWVGWGTNDGAAFVTASAAGGSIEIEPGRYLVRVDSTVPGVVSNTEWWGHGAGVSIVNPVGAGGSAWAQGGSPDTLRDVTFRDFEVDGSGVRVATYGTVNKGLYIVGCRNLTVRDMYFHDISATAVGCDTLPGSMIVHNRVDRGGAQVSEFNSGSGGSGIGLGTGKLTYEDVLIAGNTVRWCGNNGIFSESQSVNIRSQGIRIIDNYCENNIGPGISDRGCDGTIIRGNTVRGTIRLDVGFVAGLYSVNTIVEGNILVGSQIIAIVKDGDITIRDNQIVGAGIAGIDIQIAAGGTLGVLTIEGNYVKDGQGTSRGIWVEGGTWDRVLIERNRVKNVGASGSTRPGIVSAATATGMYVCDNRVWDNRGGSAGISYGLQLTGGTLTRFVYDGNDFVGAVTAADDLTGATITTQVTHFNP